MDTDAIGCFSLWSKRELFPIQVPDVVFIGGDLGCPE